MASDTDLATALDALERGLAAEGDEQRRRREEHKAGKSDADLIEEGVFLSRALVVDERPALMGRVALTLGEDDDKSERLAGFAARPGAVVVVRGHDESGRVVEGVRGVVAQRRGRTLKVVFDEQPVARDGRIDLLLLDDEVTLQRLQKAVAEARHAEGRARTLLATVLGVRDPEPTAGAPLVMLDPALHEDQVRAAWHGVRAPDVALIHGPPGTGKTRVVVEVIRQCVGRGEKVLALCASNAAADHVALSLASADEKLALARVGNVARIDERLEKKTLSALTENHERRKLAKKLFDEAFQLLANARRRSDRGREAWRREREARVEAGKLFADARQLERQAAEEVLRKTQVVCGTLTGFGRELPRDQGFDTLVVDEASQALTPALLMALPRVGRVVLAGDHKQLPPTVLSRAAEAAGLARTAFDALAEREDAAGYGHMLRVQHRMNEAIMAFPSSRFYDGALVAHDTVRDWTLADLSLSPTTIVRPAQPLEWIDTAGAGYDEAQAEGSVSRHNDMEARLVTRVVRDLINAGLPAADIGVITPYAGQVALLSRRLTDALDAGLEVDSVDGFQGREKAAIVFSATRSNPEGDIGFLDDDRRLNVALTRAQRCFVGIGDSATLGGHATWGALFEDVIARGHYRSVFELGLDG